MKEKAIGAEDSGLGRGSQETLEGLPSHGEASGLSSE